MRLNANILRQLLNKLIILFLLITKLINILLQLPIFICRRGPVIVILVRFRVQHSSATRRNVRVANLKYLTNNRTGRLGFSSNRNADLVAKLGLIDTHSGRARVLTLSNLDREAINSARNIILRHVRHYPHLSICTMLRLRNLNIV